jgi:hypothetical protein
MGTSETFCLYQGGYITVLTVSVVLPQFSAFLATSPVYILAVAMP